MFCLGEQICRHPVRIRRFVRDDHGLRRAGKSIDPDHTVDLSLGECDEQIARTKDLVHGTNRLSAISQGSDGLCAAQQIDFVHAGDGTGREDDRVHRHITVCIGTVWWCDDHDFLNPCHAGGDRTHQHTRGEGSCSTRHV